MVNGIERHYVSQYLQLTCSKKRCNRSWRSEIYVPNSPGHHDYEILQPALDMGWRVYSGRISLYMYCPYHGPTVPMQLFYLEGTHK